MTISPLAGKPAPRELLVDLGRLEREYYERRPDPDDPQQRVSFGTSGHRGSPFHGSFTEAHILAITQAICDYRDAQGTDGPIYMGKDTHALSGPAERTALEVLAANGVETIIQRERRGDADPGHLARDPRLQSRPRRPPRRRHRGHPVAQPARGWRLQIQPDQWRAGRHRCDPMDREPRQRIVAQPQCASETDGARRGIAGEHDAPAGSDPRPMSTICATLSIWRLFAAPA